MKSDYFVTKKLSVKIKDSRKKVLFTSSIRRFFDQISSFLKTSVRFDPKYCMQL